MELTEAEWKNMLETSEAEKNALIATLEAEKKTRQILEAQQNYQVSKLCLNDRMHVARLHLKYCRLRSISSPSERFIKFSLLISKVKRYC